MARAPRPFGRYLLLDRIQWGGMAEVWRACPKDGTDAIVAIKRLLPRVARDASMLSMFINEARVAVQLTHPNIAQVFDLGRVDDDVYIAMEYVPGRDLKTIVEHAAQRGMPMPIPLAALVAAHLCDALDYAHERTDASGQPMGIVHRDVSPENCLVTFDGAVKLIDFGVAKVAVQAKGKKTKTRTRALKGKLAYMSPEQAVGAPVDRRSDLFSLAVVLYEVVVGLRLFEAGNELSTLKAVCEKPIAPPRVVNPQVPAVLERIVMRGLARDPAKRYARASEMAAHLRAFLAKLSPRPDSALLQRFMGITFAAEVEEERRRRVAWAANRVVTHKFLARGKPPPMPELGDDDEPTLGDNLDAAPPPFEEEPTDLSFFEADKRAGHRQISVPQMAIPQSLLSARAHALPPPMPSPRPGVDAPPVGQNLDALASGGSRENTLRNPPEVLDALLQKLRKADLSGATTLSLRNKGREESGITIAVAPEAPRVDLGALIDEEVGAQGTFEAASNPVSSIQPLPGQLPTQFPNGPDLRRSPRWVVEVPAQGRYWIPGVAAPRPLAGTLHNLSAGGAQLHCATHVPSNATVELVMKVGFLKKLKVRGAVRWWRRTSGGCAVGIEFDEPRPEIARLIGSPQTNR